MATKAVAVYRKVGGVRHQIGLGPQAPAVPAGVTGVVNSSSQITWSWAAAAQATSYVVRINNGAGIPVPSGTTYVQSGLTATSTHTFEVAAVNAAGQSAFSSPLSRTTDSGEQSSSVATFTFPGADGSPWPTGWVQRGYVTPQGAASSVTFTQQAGKGRVRMVRASGSTAVGTMYRPFATPQTGEVLDYRGTMRLPTNPGTDCWWNICFSNNEQLEADANASAIFLRISSFGTRFVTRHAGVTLSDANVSNPPGDADLEVRFRFDQVERQAYARWWPVGTGEPLTWNVTSAAMAIRESDNASVPFLQESAWATINGIGYYMGNGVAGTFDVLVGPSTVTASTQQAPVTAGADRVVIRGGGWVTGVRVASDGTRYCKTDVGGMYRWDSTTDFWTQLVTKTGRPDESLKYHVEDLQVAPSNSNRVYVATGHGTSQFEGSRIHRSDDRGATWPVRSNQFTSSINGNGAWRTSSRLAVDPQNADHVLYGTRTGQLWRSTDGGLNFAQVTTVPAAVSNGDGQGYRVVMFAPGSTVSGGLSQHFYVGVRGVGLVKTTNGGTSFTTVAAKTDGCPSDIVRANDGTVYVTMQGGTASVVRVTPGNPDQVATILSGGRNWTSLAVNPVNADELVVMGEGIYEVRGGDGTFRHTTNARATTPTWTQISLTYTNGAKGTVWPRQSDIVDWMSVGNCRFTNDGTTLLFAEGMGMWRAPKPVGTTCTFEFASDGIEELVSSDAIKPPGLPLVTAHWDRGIYRHPAPSKTAPTASEAAYLPLTGMFGSAWDLAQSPTDPNYLVAILDAHAGGNGDRMSSYSEDGGATWTRFVALTNGTGPTAMKWGNIAISAGTGANRDNLVWVPSEAGAVAFWTKDRGMTWTQALLPGSSSHVHASHFFKKQALVAHPSTAGTFFLVGNDNSNGTTCIWRTTNGGEVWTLLSTPAIRTGYWDFQFHGGLTIAGGYLFAMPGHHDPGADRPFWRAPLADPTAWVELTSLLYARTPAVGPALPGQSNPTLFTQGRKVGTDDDTFWYSTDLGATWVAAVNHPGGSYDFVSSLSPDPEVPGKFYIGWSGTGFTSYQIQVPAPAQTSPKIGLYTGYQSSQASVEAYETWLFGNTGRKVDYVLEFLGSESTFAMSWQNYFQNHYTWLGARRLLLGTSLTLLDVNLDYNREWTWEQVATGTADATWVQLRDNLIAYGQGDCTLRGPHEFTNDKWPHRAFPADRDNFIAAWRRWHGIMQAAPGSNFQFNWNPETGDYAKTGVDLFSFFPGAAYVDRIDLDLYDRWYDRRALPFGSARTVEEQNARFDEFLNRNEPSWRGLHAWRAFAVQHGLPLGFSEVGLGAYFGPGNDGSNGGGDNAVFVNRFADFVFDPAYPIGQPGGVDEVCFWEDGSMGVRPLSPSNPDQGRAIPTPLARAAFKTRFGV